VPAGPGEGLPVGGQDRDTPLDARRSRTRPHGAFEPIEFFVARQQGGGGAALHEPARLGDGRGQRGLELRGILGNAARADLGPAALDALDLEHTGDEHDAEREAGDGGADRAQVTRAPGERQHRRPDRRRAGDPGPGPRGAVQPLRGSRGRDAARERYVSAPLHLKALVPDEVRFILERDARLLVPVGTCEQHGPHLPLGCDSIIVEHLADDLSAEFEILRAPTIEYGVNTATIRPFPGNASVRRKTLHRWMNDLLGSWEQAGVDSFIILTAHGHDPHQEALSTLRTRSARVFTVDVFALDFSRDLEDPEGPTHGGELDTSLLLYLAPELVRMERAQDFAVPERQRSRGRVSSLPLPKRSPGSLGRPSIATREKGERLYKMIRERIATRVLGAPVP